MSLPYDATVKDLARVNPRGLVGAFDEPTDLPVSLLNVDLSTVTTSADVVFGLGKPIREIVHFDFQSSASATKHADILVYNTLLHRQYQVPVHSTVILLRPQAVHPNLNGSVAYAPRPRRGRMDFGYEVVRLWDRSAEDLLVSDVSAAPFAVLGALPENMSLETGLASVVQKLIARLQRDTPKDNALRLLTAAYVLSGLRVPRTKALHLFDGVRAMRDSDTFMAIIEEGEAKGLKKGRLQGRLEEARALLFRIGTRKFGPPGKRVMSAVDAIADIEQLENILERIVEADSWRDVLTKK